MLRSFCLFLLVLLLNPTVLNASDYKWDGDKDTAATMLAFSGISQLIFMQYGEQEEINLDELDYDLNHIDITAIDNWSPTASLISDALLITELAMPLVLVSEKSLENRKTYSLLYLQSFAVTNFVSSLTKSITKRKRPYVYNTNLSDEQRTNREATNSFVSGHAANAFMASAFMMKIMYDDKVYRNYQLVIFPVFALGAGATSMLRYSAGKHFPSDIIAGAIVGAACGYIIPELHKKKQADSDYRQIISVNWKF
ncbi:MAG TPA: phosphatase PAP2 family protein [Candidatus Cloacimonadota bacterium]|jgi:membrane-associated phospholipid phosphatase|nr:phosphatase PAP2 family protein [Candidatus Cloacimonadales bacterium]HPY97232.1 phosphatase PAP2 family protein [Candidatus Cloacimonadota bacterium]HQB41757.1 phosphatase PAP2 family protein [Candidatus Cloacimonadota bacterium]